MATFLTPAQVEQQYFQILKSLKPSLNVLDPDSDFVLRGKAFTGLVSGILGDQQKVNNDTWLANARDEAVILHGLDLGIYQQPATPAGSSTITISGCTPGVAVAVGQLTFLYKPTNVLFSNTSNGTVDVNGNLVVAIQAEAAGQLGNVAAGEPLQVVSPPAGITTAAVATVAVTDGADAELISSLKARILSRLQSPPAGGNITDYPNFAFSADPSVRSAYAVRFGRGLGTVDVYITTGTTDVDSAVTNGIAVSRIPSADVLAEVQAYYDAHVPLTDCPRVYGPGELAVNVSVSVDLAPGLTLASVPADPLNNPLGLNVGQLIQREVSRVLYKLPVVGRKLSPSAGSGYVFASDIETGLDVWLSAVVDPTTGLPIGKIPVLLDREVAPLDPPAYNLPVNGNTLAAPGVITTTVGV